MLSILIKSKKGHLKIFYNEPYRRRDITFRMVKDVLELLKANKPTLAPLAVWQAFERIEKVNSKSPKSELIALVSLIRRVTGIDKNLTLYNEVVDRNFQKWIFKKQEGAVKFNKEQMEWLYMIKEHIAGSIHMDRDDLENAPFVSKGGLGKMYELFGDETDTIMDEMNGELAG